jgi:alpha-tubulin suppressor-like RCC1 family protein
MVPAGLSNVVAIAAGGYHNLALRADGTVIAWGYNAYGQTNIPLNGTNIVAVGAGGSHSLLLKADGKVIAWGYNTGGQTNVPSDLTNVVAIVSGGGDCLALVGDKPPVPFTSASNPKVVANCFSLSASTRNGRVYQMEYNNSLTDANWTALPLAAGNGGTLTLTDAAATNSQRFYRVKQW